MRDRPLNLWRWNNGIDAERVVQQEIPRGAPEWVRRVTVPRRRGGSVSHAVGGEAATLVWLANQNCITPHAWTSRADRPDRPDRLIFDLDPSGDDAFEAIREGALALREQLSALGLEPFAMTSGSRGLHVVAPLRRTADTDRVRAVAGVIAEELAARHPETLTTEWRKVSRGGRVLVDVARNTYAQTDRRPLRRPRAARRAGGRAAGVGRGRRPRRSIPAAGRCAPSPGAWPRAATRGRRSARSARALPKL